MRLLASDPQITQVDVDQIVVCILYIKSSVSNANKDVFKDDILTVLVAIVVILHGQRA